MQMPKPGHENNGIRSPKSLAAMGPPPPACSSHRKETGIERVELARDERLGERPEVASVDPRPAGVQTERIDVGGSNSDGIGADHVDHENVADQQTVRRADTELLEHQVKEAGVRLLHSQHLRVEH